MGANFRYTNAASTRCFVEHGSPMCRAHHGVQNFKATGSRCVGKRLVSVATKVKRKWPDAATAQCTESHTPKNQLARRPGPNCRPPFAATEVLTARTCWWTQHQPHLTTRPCYHCCCCRCRCRCRYRCRWQRKKSWSWTWSGSQRRSAFACFSHYDCRLYDWLCLSVHLPSALSGHFSHQQPLHAVLPVHESLHWRCAPRLSVSCFARSRSLLFPCPLAPQGCLSLP